MRLVFPSLMRWCITPDISSQCCENSKLRYHYSKHHIMMTWYPNYIFDKYTFFTIIVAMAFIQNIIFNKGLWRKHNCCHILQIITDIITIFGRVWDMDSGIISVKCCLFLPQEIELLRFPCFCGYLFSEIISNKTLKITNKFTFKL